MGSSSSIPRAMTLAIRMSSSLLRFLTPRGVRDSSPRTAPHASDRCTHTPLTSRRSLGGAIRNYRERVPDAIAQWQKDSASTKVPLPHSSLLPLSPSL